jgi:hypothetical protein
MDWPDGIKKATQVLSDPIHQGYPFLGIVNSTGLQKNQLWRNMHEPIRFMLVSHENHSGRYVMEADAPIPPLR